MTFMYFDLHTHAPYYCNILYIAIRQSVSAICKVQVRLDDARNQKYSASTDVCWDGLPIHEMALRRIASSLTRRNDKNTMKNVPGECA